MAEDSKRVKPPAELKSVKKLEQSVVDKTGFDPIEILEAPAKPPELKNTRPRPSTLQYVTLATGLALIAIGLFVWALLALFYAGVALMAIGTLGIALAVLVRL